MKLKILRFLYCTFFTIIFFSCSMFTKGEIVEAGAGQNAKKWSLLVYMSADNNLESYALEDLYEMERSKLNTRKANVLILLDRSPAYDTTNGNWSDTKLYLLSSCQNSKTYDISSKELDCSELGLEKNTSVEIDMSSSFVLSTVLNYMYENFPAEKYGLIMWGHGTGWRGENSQTFTDGAVLSKGFAYDTTSNSYMGLKQLGEGLKAGLKGKVLDFIGFDTCYGGEIEVLYELKDYVNYAAGSAGLVVSSGWDYEKLFNEFEQYSEKSEEELCQAIVKQFKLQYENRVSSAVSAVNMKELSDFFNVFELFMKEAAELIDGIEIRDKVITSIINNSVLYTEGTSGSDVYVDLDSLCKIIFETLSIKENTDLLNLETAYSILQASETSLILSSWSESTGKSSPGIYLGTLASSGLFSAKHPSAYIKGKTLEQISFVQNSNWYVPSDKTGGSFLDKLFYTTNW